MPKKIFIQDLDGTRRRGKPRNRWKKELGKDRQVLGVRRWREWWQIGKNGRTLFDSKSPQWAVVSMEEEEEEEEKEE